MGTGTSAPVLQQPLPATSLVANEGQGKLRQSLPDINHEIAKDIQGIKEARQTLGPVIHSIKGQATQSQTLPANRSLSELPPKQAGPLYEREYKTVRGNNKVEMQQGKKTKKILKPVSELSMSRNIFRVAEVETLQGQISDILTTSKPESAQMKNVMVRDN